MRAAASNHQNLRVVVGTKGQRGWEAWGEGVRRRLGLWPPGAFAGSLRYPPPNLDGVYSPTSH